MSDRLKELKSRSQKRRQLLAQQLGVSNPDEIGKVLSSKDEKEDEKNVKQNVSSTDTPPAKRRAASDGTMIDTSTGYNPMWDLPPGADGEKAEEEEEEKEEIYTDSSAFLKGTQSANPHNDYCQHFVDSGERPQNFIRDVGLANRFEEYPKLRELIKLKDELIEKTNTPPMYLKCDLQNFNLRDLECKFDVILIEPPLEEYQRSLGVVKDKFWSWDEIEKLQIQDVAAQRSFLWIWCGSSDGLDAGRRCLKRWGFRRCEDICWIKTNIKNPGHSKNLEPKSVFQRTKEHCLMGIKGTVRRSTDFDFIHANVDIDLIIEEEKPWGSDEKPVELMHMIEHFCLGRRRLQLFGKDTTIRPGWLTIGPELTSSNFDAEVYSSYFSSPGGELTGCTDEIERLRPKSPTPKDKAMRGRGGRGGDRGGRGGRGAPRGGGRGWGGDRGRGGGRGMRGGPRETFVTIKGDISSK